MTRAQQLVIAGLAVVLSLLVDVPNGTAQHRSPADVLAVATADVDVVRDSTTGGFVFRGALYVRIDRLLPVASVPAALQDVARAVGSPLSLTSTFGVVVPDDEKRRISSRETIDRLERLAVVGIPAASDPWKTAQMLVASGLVEHAEPIPVHLPFRGTPDEPNDPLLENQNHIDYLNTRDAWLVEQGDTNVVIAIIDAGITRDHEDLRGNIAPNYGEIGLDSDGADKATNGMDDDNNGRVDDAYGINLVLGDGIDPGETVNGEHGTQVTGFAAAVTDNDLGIAGTANQCRFFPMKAAPRGRASIIAGYDGLLYAASRGMKVANLSWGSPVYSAIEEEIMRTVINDFDVAVVASGGNENGHVVYYPAGYRDVIGVAGVNAASAVNTTWGEHIDLVSTGGTTTSGLNEYFDLPAASSYAAPSISGVVALARSAHPEVSARAIAHHVRQTGRSITLFNLGKEEFIGRGRPDAREVVANEPTMSPGIVIDSLILDLPEGHDGEFLALGDSGSIRVALSNLLGPATNVTISIENYTDDSLSMRLGSTSMNVGDLPKTTSSRVLEPIPITIVAPGRPLLRLRFRIAADGYDDVLYEVLPIQRTWVESSGDRIGLAVTNRGRIGIDRTERGAIGPGVRFDDIDQLFEGGLIVSTSPQIVLDNLRNENSVFPNDDFVPLDPDVFGRDVDVAFTDDGDRIDRVGLRFGMRGEITDDPRVGVVTLIAENFSEAPIDSLRVGLFNDWDLGGQTGGGSVSLLDLDSLNARFMPVVSRIDGAGGTVLIAAIERPSGDSSTPIHFAIDNPNAPVAINDGFSDAEKFRVVASGLGNESAGPGDISLVSGLVFSDLPHLGSDSLRLVLSFSTVDVADAVAGLVSYFRDRYGFGNVPDEAEDTGSIRVINGQLVWRSPNRSTVTLYDIMGRNVIERALPTGGGALIDTKNLAGGTYLYTVTFSDGRQIRRMVHVGR